MEINLVVLNVGNSRLAVAPMVAGEMGAVRRIPNSQQQDWQSAIAEAWKLIDGRENAAIVGAGVNPEMQKVAAEAAMAAAERRVVWVGKDLELPMQVMTDAPEQTGVDRILCAAAAYEQIEDACVIVDAGTAITIDCCNDAGHFLGGAIAPGLRMQLESLHEHTAALPSVADEFARPEEPFGTSTKQAMFHGVYHGIRGMVKELVENYATALGRWPDVIATGGDAAMLFDGWELIHAISPDLQLYGTALAYTNHHLKHDAE